MRKQLDSLKGRTVLQWVPSHINVPGNELADSAAKEATEMNNTEDCPISYNAARALIKRKIIDPHLYTVW